MLQIDVDWQRSLRSWLVYASCKRLVRSTPFRISWHGIRDAPMNLLTNGFMNNCGRLFGPSEQFEADASLTTIRISSYIPAMFKDSALRLLIYDEIVRTGDTPLVVPLPRLLFPSLPAA